MENDLFQLEPGLIYLNHAAVSPWPQRTVTAIQQFAVENGSIGSSHYPQWIEVENRLRQRLSGLIQVGIPDDIALLKSTSEGLSVVAHGLNWEPGDNVVISDQEFPSNAIIWESLARYGVTVKKVNLNSAATPEEALAAAVDAQTRLLSISSVQFGDGLRMDLQAIGTLCRERNILFCVDAIQSLGALAFEGATIQPDFIVADGHKWMMAPEGCALFYSTPEARAQLQLHQYGWHMREQHLQFESNPEAEPDWQIACSARRFEAGSPNMLGIHGLEASLSLIEEIGIHRIEQLVLERTGFLIQAIEQHPRLELITITDPARRSGIITFSVKGQDIAQLFAQLTEQGIQCAQRAGGIRLSPHFYTPMEQLQQTLDLVDQLIE